MHTKQFKGMRENNFLAGLINDDCCEECGKPLATFEILYCGECISDFEIKNKVVIPLFEVE